MPKDRIFLNIPYDDTSADIFLAYIVGAAELGLDPVVTLGIPGGNSRLDRILDLIQSCRYSLHDLSRVQLDLQRPMTPRFNMPFEAGLAVATARLMREGTHDFFIFESVPHRLLKSTSDLNGVDPHIHGGTVTGVLREMSNAFVRNHGQPTVPEMLASFKKLKLKVPEVMRDAAADSIFSSSVFHRLRFTAFAYRQQKRSK